MIFQNVSNPLVLPTHEGSGQAVHPSVIDFKVEHGISAWGGYRYWMVMTPYPFTDDAHEDPNLIASNDNVNWVVPNGIINPLDDALGGMTDGFHNDPDMIYNPITNELWLYYRFSRSDKQEIKLIKISENMTTTEPIVVHLLEPFSQAENKTRSMCIWRESETKWHMWGSGGVRPYTNYYYSSVDGMSWSEPQQVLNGDGVDPFHAIGYENWHTSCKPNYKEGRIEFFTCCWVLGEGNNTNAKIIYSEMHMNNPLLISKTNPVPVLGTKSGSWDNSFLYRCSVITEDLGNRYKYHMYYSAMGSGSVWGIGYTSFEETPDNPTTREIGTYWHQSDVEYSANFKIANKKVKIGDYWHLVKETFVKR